MGVDADFYNRLEILVDLAEVNPDKSMKKLQWEALKYYPLYYKETIRAWMTTRIAFIAAEMINYRLLKKLEIEHEQSEKETT